MMRKYLKHVSSLVLIPFTQWYLKKERTFSYDDIAVTVKPGVFHPGFFYSTKFLLSYLKEKNLGRKTFLELGCGTGLISIFAAKQNAIVTASDISTRAVENSKANAIKNNVEIAVINSDLFASIPSQTFDWIVVNPPYYAKDATNEAEYAWHCGQKFDYFENFFRQLSSYSNDKSSIVMVLTKGCDLKSIFAIAEKNNYSLALVREKQVLFDEKDYLFEIRKADRSS